MNYLIFKLIEDNNGRFELDIDEKYLHFNDCRSYELFPKKNN